MPTVGVVTESEAVAALCAVARPIILEDYRPDSCLVSSFIAIETLAYFGVPAVGRACKVMAWNRRYSERFSQGVRPLDDPEAHAVGIGYYDRNWREHVGRPGRSDKPYWGHLVAETRNFVVDLSLDQASRPERGIVLGPRAWPRDEGWPRERAVYIGDDGVVIYEPDAGRNDFKKLWRQGPYREVTGRVIRAVRAQLEAA